MKDYQKELITNQNGTEQKSEAIRDIITSVPSWHLRWGITIVLSIIIVAIFMLNIIKYPQIIETRMEVCIKSEPKNSQSRGDKRILNNYYGILYINQRERFKVKVNQKVIIKLDSYSQGIYDIFEGKITAVQTKLDKNGQYLVDVEFKSNSRNQGRSPNRLSRGLKARAKIIIQENSLLSMFINKIERPLASSQHETQ